MCVSQMDCLSRYRSAAVSDWAGSRDGSVRGRQTPTLVVDMLGQKGTPRWLGDPYGVGENGEVPVSPVRSDFPRIAAALGRRA